MNAMKLSKLAAVGVAAAVLGTVGCATKKYVRQSVDQSVQPLQVGLNKTNQQVSENGQQIQNVDRRAETGISNAQNSADQANQAAKAADQHAQTAQQTAEKGVSAANQAQEMVNNIDNYKPAQQATILFGFDKSNLTAQDKQRLDNVVQAVKPLKHYVIQIRGYTDSSGAKGYNLQLSQKRANAVVRYLTLNGEIPLVRIYSLGYGEAAPVNPNSSRKGRELNRRVDVTIFVPQMPGQEAQSTQAQASPAPPTQ